MTIAPKPDVRTISRSTWLYPELQKLYPGYEATRAISVFKNRWEAAYWATGYIVIGTYNTREEAEIAAQVAFDMRLYSDREEPRS